MIRDYTMSGVCVKIIYESRGYIRIQMTEDWS